MKNPQKETHFVSKSDFYATEGEQFEMFCYNSDIESLSDMTVYLPNGLKAETNEFLVVKMFENYPQIFIQKPLKSRDEGTYKCESSNGFLIETVEKTLKFVTESFIKLEGTNFSVTTESNRNAEIVIGFEAFPSPVFVLFRADRVQNVKLNSFDEYKYRSFMLKIDNEEDSDNDVHGLLSEKEVTITVDNISYSRDYILTAKNPGNFETVLISFHVFGEF